MTYEKHTTHTDALDTLGSLIGPDEKRDAIHLAVEPATAGCPLRPGDHVIYDDDGRAVIAEVGCGIGIVDPFLADGPDTGESFWLVVYPRQITSLRHVWEHPQFKPSEIALYAAAHSAALTGDAMNRLAQLEAKEWLRNYAKTLDITDSDDYGDSTTFDEFVEKVASADDDYIIIRGGDMHGLPIPDEVFEKVAVLRDDPSIAAKAGTGVKMDCSC